MRIDQGFPTVPEPKPFAIVVMPRATHPLLRPGAPVYSLLNDLLGWTVEATNGNTIVHAPTEGDGHEHAINVHDRWGLLVWWTEGLVDAGWDRLRRSVPITADATDPVEVASKIFEPDMTNLTRVCLAAQQRGILVEVVVIDRTGPPENPGFVQRTLHPDASAGPTRIPAVLHLARRRLWGWTATCELPWTGPADHGVTTDPQRVNCEACLKCIAENETQAP